MPDENTFDPYAATRTASETLNVGRAFGAPYEHAGRTVIPVAKIMGATGSGGGQGTEEDADTTKGTRHGDGGGGGYAARVKPLGVYVIDDAGVRWRPAIDVNRIVLGGQIVGAVALGVLGATVGLALALRGLRHGLAGHHGHHHGPHGHHGLPGHHGLLGHHGHPGAQYR